MEIMKCKQCNNEYEATGRSLYCSTACKQAFYRNRLKGVTVTKSVTIEPARYDKPVTVTSSSMTVMERLFYRPADKLKPGELNFVSLPGRACYKPMCETTRAWCESRGLPT